MLVYLRVVPELPEVEVLVRHLAPLLRARQILEVDVRRARIVSPDSPTQFEQRLRGQRFGNVSRRGKYLVFHLALAGRGEELALVGHLGMTGRMYVLPTGDILPKHAAVVLRLDSGTFVFEDTRYFGRLTFDASAIEKLGPEPFGDDFTVEGFSRSLERSAQAIKVKLLDQTVVAGIGNIYASEALFRAGISPRIAAQRLCPAQITHLRQAIRETLTEAIALGSTVPFNYSGSGQPDGLFYFGRAPGAADLYEETLRVYDRAGQPCVNCGSAIKRIVQAARSTFFCPECQRRHK